jgi:AcrR family transcriptional regulator
MSPENYHGDDKRQLIISAAQKLFGIHGAEKISMREIAGVLHMSKASIYYYFPDKENLYRAVLEKEQKEFLETLKKVISDNPDPAGCLRSYALTRLSYFRHLVNLGRLSVEAFPGFRPLIADSFRVFREKEKELVVQILERGRKNRQFNITEVYRTASLFLEIQRGLRSLFFTNRKFVTIDKEGFGELEESTASAAEIFIKGLMFNNQDYKTNISGNNGTEHKEEQD